MLDLTSLNIHPEVIKSSIIFPNTETHRFEELQSMLLNTQSLLPTLEKTSSKDEVMFVLRFLALQINAAPGFIKREPECFMLVSQTKKCTLHVQENFWDLYGKL